MAKKNSDEAYELPQLVAIMGSGVVGALSYTFSDTFWLSAIEAEVYSFSSFFTAIVFWAILKWENIADERYSNRWLILIAYLMGLSIGVHLLNLLAIPAIVFVYYHKKYEASRNGFLLASVISVAILGTVIYGIIPGLVSIASKFELLFVNSFGMPFNTGVLIYFILLSAGIIGGIYFTYQKRMVLLNTIITAVMVIIIGYSSYAMIVIRSMANPPMDENNPENVFALLSYLNREQYGDRPLFSGQYFNAEVDGEEERYTYVPLDDSYKKIKMTNPKYIFDKDYSTIFPRMYSRQQTHKNAYISWAGISDASKKPSFAENLTFFLTYQVGHMYLRYFMWNFAGRQNNYQGHGGQVKGNWLSGIDFLDSKRLGDQSSLPESMKNNEARNKYYLLPFLLGLIGLAFMAQYQSKDFLVVLLLFFFTGIAIVLYLNQTPYQPRERDYAYAGSFYAFTIWIGLGVVALFDWMKKITPATISAGLAIVFSLSVPVIMASENWDDHDRSGRYAARDFASNYLNSCAPNAILFTYGDNDTFPLWYAQEVEGIRTDVRVVNLSLLGTDWYINQMKRDAYDSKAVPFAMTHDKYMQGVRDFLPVSDRVGGEYASVKEVMDFVASDDERTKVTLRDESKVNYIPAEKLVIDVDTLKVVRNKTVVPERIDSIMPYMPWIINKKYVSKSEMMIMDLIAHNDWERPIYFASSIGGDNFLNLQNYFQLEGFAYRLVPFITPPDQDDIGYVNTDILYDNMMNKFSWGRLNEDDVLVDNFVERVAMVMQIRETFTRLARELIKENKKKKAIAVLDRCLSVLPQHKVPYDYSVIPMVEAYYLAGDAKKGNDLANDLGTKYIEKLTYYFSLNNREFAGYSYETKVSMSVLQSLLTLSAEHNQNEFFDKLNSKFEIFYDQYTDRGL